MRKKSCPLPVLDSGNRDGHRPRRPALIRKVLIRQKMPLVTTHKLPCLFLLRFQNMFDAGLEKMKSRKHKHALCRSQEGVAAYQRPLMESGKRENATQMPTKFIVVNQIHFTIQKRRKIIRTYRQL